MQVAQSRRLEELRRLAEIAKQVNAAATVRDALRVVGEGARTLIGAHQSAASARSDGADGKPVAVFLLSEKYAAWRDYDEPFDGRGIYRLIGETLRPIRLTQAELEAHPAWRDFGAARDRHPPMRGWLAVPLIGGDGQYVGMLQLSDRLEGDFTAEDEALLVQLAEIVAGALERLRLYEAARAAEQRFRQFAEIASDWLWETDAEHRLAYRSSPRRPGASIPQAALLGGRRWEMPGANPDDPLWAAHIADLEQRRAFRDFEYSVTLPDGNLRRVRTSGHPLFAPDGRFLGYRGAGSDVTAQHRAELAMQSREASFRYLFEHNPNPMWVFDRETYAFLAVNQAAVAKYGYSREEFARMRILDIRPPADAERLVDSMRDRDESLRQAGAWRHVTKSGDLLDVEIESHGLEFDGRAAVLVLARDITARKRAEDRLRDFLEIGSDWLWETDAEHRFLSFSAPRGGAELVNADAFLGRRRWDVPGIQPSSGSWDPHIADLEARREFRDFEYSAVGGDGRLRHVQVSGRPAFDADGRFAGYRGIATDVTQRRELESAHRLMFEQNPNPMWIYDIATLEFLAVNEAAVARYGYSREEFARMRLSDIRPAEDEAVLRKAIGEMPAAWASVGVWRHLTKDGRLRYVELDTNRTEFAGRTAVAVLVRDITERREAEAKLAETEARLRQAQKLEAVGQLTGGVAHDFNNLLTVILGNLELIEGRLGTVPGVAGPLAAVQRAADRGADLTRYLLAFARRQPLDPRDTDVNALALGLQSLIVRTIGESVDIRIVPGENLWSAIVDPAQLETSLLNLAINARDAMPHGGKLTIETANVELDSHYAEMNPEVVPGAYVMVSVSDTGTGMTPEVVAKAFDPFFTTKATGKGSGLGLSMVYGFVKQSGGHVKLYSELGHGTSVKLYLPRGALTDVAAVAEPAADGSVAGGEIVLVVEDDEMVRSIAVDHLTALGYHTVAAFNGVEALKLLETDAAIDLLFTDVVMPGGVNGRELAERARVLRPGLKVLFTSGYTENAIVHHGRLDPGVMLLQKPYRRQALAAKVREALGS